MKRAAHGRRRIKKRKSGIGSAPGTLIADHESGAPAISVLAYRDDDFTEYNLENLEDIPALLEKYSMVWVDVIGLGQTEPIQRLGEIFNLHKLALEDVFSKSGHPKLEDYDCHFFMIARSIIASNFPETTQVNMFFDNRFVLTIHDTETPELEPVRQRIRQKSGRIRALGADYIAYAVIDAVIDAYYPLLETLGETLEDLEFEITTSGTIESIQHLHRLKRELLDLRRSIWPLREAINKLIRDGGNIISAVTSTYLRDCLDHVVQIIELIENYREVCSDLISIYLSTVSNKTNDVMKVLTIIATIFIPLTFLAGVYGMNFDPDSSPWNMPELRSLYGYPIFWLVSIIIAILLMIYFQKRGWLGSGKK